jgi:hypothetical protein
MERHEQLAVLHRTAIDRAACEPHRQQAPNGLAPCRNNQLISRKHSLRPPLASSSPASYRMEIRHASQMPDLLSPLPSLLSRERDSARMSHDAC